MERKFDLEEVLEQIKAGASLGGNNGVLAPLIKQLTEVVLEGEIETHLSQELARNRRNGKSKKTMKSFV